MAEANERIVGIGSNREMATTNLSLFPRDLLQGFTPVSAEAEDEEEDDDDEEEEAAAAEIELNLGLSLGGRFGVDKNISGSKKLTRSSSIVGTMPILREEKVPAATVAAEAEIEPRASTAPPYMGLTRTTSLPTVTGEEWRKRKEMQTLRRLEAKRRRSEKQRSSKIKTEANNLAEGSGSRPHGGANTAASGLPRWSLSVNKGGFLRKLTESSRQGSVESHGRGGGGAGGSLSSMSELESKHFQASSSRSEEARSPNTTHSSQQERASQEATALPVTKPPETTSKTTVNALRRLSSVDMNMQVKAEKSEMPSVFTKGEGPNGRRVDGILYRYGKGEEVRIMCVCHGSFLSPAEFVKHAGGGDVDNPLRHIVVNTASSSSSSFLL